MNEQVKQRWIEALRSGKYKQGSYGLRLALEDSTVEYCCLGVLYDIESGEWFESDTTPLKLSDDVEKAFKCSEENITGERSSTDEWLTDEFRDNVGLGEDEMERLADMNDKGKSFDQIADYIEENL